MAVFKMTSLQRKFGLACVTPDIARSLPRFTLVKISCFSGHTTEVTWISFEGTHNVETRNTGCEQCTKAENVSYTIANSRIYPSQTDFTTLFFKSH